MSKKEMKEITIDIPLEEQIKINGEIFPLNVAGVDLLEKAMTIMEDSEKINKNPNISPREITSTIKSIISLVDEMLGKGALKRLAKRDSVDLSVALIILNAVVKEVYKDYDKKINTEYGI